MSKTLTVQQPRWAHRLNGPARYKGAYGGRGSGKSQEFAGALILEHVADPNMGSVCVREVQKSIDQSVKKLLEEKIEEYNAGWYFDVQRSIIKSKNGKGDIMFSGMQDHTADSIKSLQGRKICFIEEAQSLKKRSVTLVRPTFREDDSQIWAVWNPYLPTDPIDELLRADPPPKSVVVEANWRDNPWFPSVLYDEMMYDKERDYEGYLHVWEGHYVTAGEARVFKNYKVETFDTPEDAQFMYGMDFGFAVDPTAVNRCFIKGRKLYIDYEAHSIGCEIEDLPALLSAVPDAHLWPLCADSSRPETISYLRKNGYPKIVPSVKGKGSVKEGVAWLKSYDIVIHPRCVNTIQEFNLHKYKTDRNGTTLPLLEDSNNHHIDAIRYACEASRRLTGGQAENSVLVPPKRKNFW